MFFHLYYPHPSHYSVCHGVAYAFEPPGPQPTRALHDRVDLKRSRYLGKITLLGGSPGLVVTGGDPCSIGRVFESQHHTLS